MSTASLPPAAPRIVQRTVAGEDALPRDLHPVLRRVLLARGVRSLEDLDYRTSRLCPPGGLGELDTAAARIAAAVREGERTVVVGDYDADGATGTAVCLLALRALGHPDVEFVVPDRARDGYGLGADLAARIHEERAPGLIITVDNGISSLRGVAIARARDMDVVVTDHHLPGPELPPATAIVNPNLAGASFPSKHLAGVGVAFYTMLATRRALETDGGAGRRPQPFFDLLDLVALGTVADLVPLDFNNRLLVSQGLRRIRHGRCRPGLRALLELTGRDLGRVTASDLAFAVAPRLNAAGRLEDMGIGIRCLLAEDLGTARPLAERLHRLNEERRQRQAEMQLEAEAQLETVAADQRVLCALDEHWHPGIVGLVASRLVERWHRPAIAFAPESPGASVLKGSARSIAGFHIRDVLARIDARHPGLVARFGGHAMAAGLSLERERFEAFSAALRDCAEELLDPELLAARLWTDGELGAADLSVELAVALRDWGPWGQGFPEPVFEGAFEIVERRAIGARHSKLLVRPPGASGHIEALVFNRPLDRLPEHSRLRLVYQLEVNEFRGRVTPQLVVRHLEAP